MRSVAIICEYNPFHRGHEHLLSEVRARFPGYAVISVMSGNTVQRGDFSVYGKYERAYKALAHGSDIVLELPFPYSCSAGEQFARAGVFIANAMGAEVLAFGSESGNAESLIMHAENLLSSEFEKELAMRAKKNPNESYIRLKTALYEEMFSEPLPEGGNDMLGIEYIKSIISRGYGMRAEVFSRITGYSATQSRAAIFSGDTDELSRLVPEYGKYPSPHLGLRGMGDLVLSELRLGHLSDSGNGIVNSMISCAGKTNDIDEFFSLLPTANYTSARLRRELISAVFGVTDGMKNRDPGFTVLLGATGKGTEYLASRRKFSDFPVLTKYSDASVYNGRLDPEILLCKRVDSIYGLFSPEKKMTQFIERPIILK